MLYSISIRMLLSCFQYHFLSITINTVLCAIWYCIVVQPKAGEFIIFSVNF
jgi:hypothetical protein